MAKTAITPTRNQDFAEWYQQVIIAADLAENSPVRGCMVIKPYGYAIWENIQRIFDAKIKKLGVENAYFPLLIPLEFLSKEAEHIDGFAKECAVITHHRLKKGPDGRLVPDGELQSPYIIRPTSEAIIGNVISKWINTYRDLPLKLNQWCNVMRWEMRPRMFLRTSEFLWQEGHTVFETELEAREDALKMLNTYYDFMTQELALPAIKGEKTPEERFPGAKNTYTLETMTQDGKALQAGTSHYLGQSFSNAFNIKFLGRDNAQHTAYTTSWGISTRLIGGIIMTHADDDGLVLPPAIAPHQVVIIPLIHDNANAEQINAYCTNVQQSLESLNVRTHIDTTENSPPNKIWKWIKKGAPIRLEIGFKEVSESKLTLGRRDKPKPEKTFLTLSQLNEIPTILKQIEDVLRQRSIVARDCCIQSVNSVHQLDDLFNSDFKGWAIMDKDLTDQPEFDEIAKKHSLSRRCIPQEGYPENTVFVAKSY